MDPLGAAVALTAALALLAASPAHGRQCERGTLAGAVSDVRDGDTIEVAGRAIRLQGLAAPEGDESGGAEAQASAVGVTIGESFQVPDYCRAR